MSILKVLIVDDELFFRRIISEWIKSCGYEATAVSNGEEAVDLVKNKKFDVIILDYLMPEMDGVATLKAMRKIDRDVDVIMLTGHPTTESMAGAGKLGITSYVTKMNINTDIQNTLKSIFDMIERKRKK